MVVIVVIVVVEKKRGAQGRSINSRRERSHFIDY
jgi:hypothetical protein